MKIKRTCLSILIIYIKLNIQGFKMNEVCDYSKKSISSVDVIEGKAYYWCSCGQSAKQPFCDGSHKGTTFNPVVFKATETKKMYFCGCKVTSNQPFCDGTHNSL